jgi:hypothetical protein
MKQYPEIYNENFVVALYKIFLMVIKILDSPLFHTKRSLYSKVFKSFKSKYKKTTLK